MKKLTWVFVLSLLTLAGCASLEQATIGGNPMPDEEGRKTASEQFPNLSKEQKARFLAGKPWVGMTQEQLNALMGGGPANHQDKITAEGDEIIEVYRERVGNWKTGINTRFFKVRMIDGKLKDYQEIDEYAGNLDKL